MANPPKSKEEWLKVLKNTSIPSFGSSIQALSSADSYSKKHAAVLARTILKDPNLTASVLKLANSVHFNHSGRSIRTISRSIMVLGHKAVKEVCASCLLIDSFLKNDSSRTLKAMLARSFHSAIQAKEIALLRGEKSTEEIFISALLLNLGEIAVYSAIDEKAAIFHELINAYPLADGKEREILGCYFNDLTLGLCDAWNIAPMISQVVGGHYDEKSPLRSILLGHNFAASCEIAGVDNAVEKHLRSISRYTGKQPELITDKIVEATEETAKSLNQLGLKLDIKQGKKPSNIATPSGRKIVIDKTLQLDVIQELSQVIEESLDINIILQQILEGIQRGAGFSNSLVALLTPDRSRLVAKHAIEAEDGRAKENFNFSCYHDVPEIQQKVLTNRYIVQQSELREQGMTRKQILKRTGAHNAVWGPLVVENKVIGCIYADNGTDGPPISLEQLDAFQLFVVQARLFLHKIK